MSAGHIVVRGARQHNLKSINLTIPLNKLTVVTGVSGSGKSSLAFDTLYAEGQRRYIETFSPYARQFLDRMDRPDVDEIHGIPAAIAIDQTNPVKTTRSTVGTMTEINDYLKLLFAKAGVLHCRDCGQPVRRDEPDAIFDTALGQARGQSALITFPVPIPARIAAEEVVAALRKEGFRRLYRAGEVVTIDAPGVVRAGAPIEVVQDKIALTRGRRKRLVDSLEQALRYGKGRVSIVPENGETLKFSTGLHCPDCDLEYRNPYPNLFSFNSPLGACPACRGFGKVIEIDPDLVIPDPSLSVAHGAIKPWVTPAYRECQYDLIEFCESHGIPTGVPFADLSDEQRRWIIEGHGDFYGIRGFFDWLQTKSYKMHVRIQLARYRMYTTCRACNGSRLAPDALLYRFGRKTIAALWALPIEETARFFGECQPDPPLDEAAQMVLMEVKSRLRFLVDVGLGYLTLDRQSRTLSGGEVERVNLTTALGASLMNTLYVLDEPSIGLHPRDINRLIEVLHNLRDRANTLVVVEHDRDIIRAADNVIDLGPGPGARGGQVIYSGTRSGIGSHKRSVTGAYLTGRKALPLPATRRAPDPQQAITVVGAAEHNLKEIDLEIPLGRFVCVTGVSGSGKSTLVEEVLYQGLKRAQGRPEGKPGRCRAIRGVELVDDVVLVDQSPVARSPSSNPVTYIKAFDGIRNCFAQTELAVSRGYRPGSFSFNSKFGRCEVCAGHGFEKIEMQFLSDVYIKCSECDGKRYREEVLEVEYRSRNIADVLAMTVAEAIEFFADQSKIVNSLRALVDVGLGYVALGQPANTLSGGEAQRLKLVGHIALTSGQNTLFIFDEPTTGMHPDDISVLVRAFEKLIDRGHSILVIEHNLDVVKCADWVIDLGPEGGEAGGYVVATGPPEEIARQAQSYTGKHLKDYLTDGRAQRRTATRPSAAKPSRGGRRPSKAIEILGAREHNLKNLKVKIPRDKLVVVTGISGSGKSTLAFDILFAEGQRRYLEGLSAYVRQYVTQLSRPDVAVITGVPPTVAIEQRTSRGGRKSTVATVTEIYHYLRLLFAKAAEQFCPDCDRKIEPQPAGQIVRRILRDHGRSPLSLLAPLVQSRKGFHTEIVKWAGKKGYAKVRVDGRYVAVEKFPRLDRYREHSIEALVAEFQSPGRQRAQVRAAIEEALSVGRGLVVAAAPARPDTIYSTKRTCPDCGRSFPEPDPRMFSFNSPHGACTRCNGMGVLTAANETETPCPECSGTRLRPEPRAFRLRGMRITELVTQSVQELDRTLARLRFRAREAEVSRQIIGEIRSRLGFLQRVGLSYLTLDRRADTLAGGEAQRIRLAAQLGSNLRGACYILDEPTIGLHPRDNRRLVNTLQELRDNGNSVVIVEHDDYTIRCADHVIDLGPGAGLHGGEVVVSGSLAKVARSKASATARYLKEPLPHPMRQERRPPPAEWIEVLGASENNLKNLDVKIPLGRLTCVTGVSGSGKSSLVGEVLYKGLRARHSKKRLPCGAHRGLRGAKFVDRVLEVDQSPIGRTPRSTPGTYVNLLGPIRELFARAPDARVRGYSPSRFSFNVKGGRCEKCQGQGRLRIEMSFLPNVEILCEECEGRRFDQETLSVQFRGKTIADVLDLTVEDALAFFRPFPAIRHTLQLLSDIGLGYLTLGQRSPTLSGGEAQRIKLVAELAKRGRGHTLYVLEEPTTGLHTADIVNLVNVLQRLVDQGHTIVVVEHNLDVIAEADHVIDLGPEGGDEGGRIVAEGPPEEIVRRSDESYTGKFLKEVLR